MSAGSDFDPATHEPTRALLLAHALDMCIAAERNVPGSADLVIAQQPAWARAELRRLVALAGSLDAAAASAVMSDEFRVAARVRLMRHVAGDTAPVSLRSGWVNTLPSRNGYHPVTQRGHARWMWRGGAGGLLAATLLIGATLTASANALPGDPLYGVKQVREEVGIRLAPDDQSRALALLAEANARLDETARLLDEGRTEQATATTQQFDDTLDRATTTYVVTIAAATGDDPTSSHMETQLTEQQQELQTLLASAPEPARADLRQALVATERSRALVADPKPVEVALGHTAKRPAAAVAVPTVAAEALVTDVPDVAEQASEMPSAPPPIDLVAQATPETAPDEAETDAQRVAVQPVISSAPVVVTGNTSRGGRAQSGVVATLPSHEDEPPAIAEQHEDSPVAQVANQAPVVSQPAHGADDHADVAEQPTPAPVAHQSVSPPTTESAPVVAAQPARSSSSSQSSHDTGDGKAQTTTAASSTVRASTSTTSAATSDSHATSASAESAHASGSGNDSEHGSNSTSDNGGHASASNDSSHTSNTSSDSNHTSTSSSNGDSSHGH